MWRHVTFYSLCNQLSRVLWNVLYTNILFFLLFFYLVHFLVINEIRFCVCVFYFKDSYSVPFPTVMWTARLLLLRWHLSCSNCSVSECAGKWVFEATLSWPGRCRTNELASPVHYVRNKTQQRCHPEAEHFGMTARPVAFYSSCTTASVFSSIYPFIVTSNVMEHPWNRFSLTLKQQQPRRRPTPFSLSWFKKKHKQETTKRVTSSVFRCIKLETLSVKY